MKWSIVNWSTCELSGTPHMRTSTIVDTLGAKTRLVSAGIVTVHPMEPARTYHTSYSMAICGQILMDRWASRPAHVSLHACERPDLAKGTQIAQTQLPTRAPTGAHNGRGPGAPDGGPACGSIHPSIVY